MATALPNLVFVPCVNSPTGTTVEQPDGAAVFRSPTPVPLNLAANTAGPSGPQLWPLAL